MTGSKEGGLTLTIYGNYFDDAAPYTAPRAYIGGMFCLSGIFRKPVFGVSNQGPHKRSCTATEFRKSKDCIIYVAKTKGLHGYRAADLGLCFSHMQKAGFLMMRHIAVKVLI